MKLACLALLLAFACKKPAVLPPADASVESAAPQTTAPEEEVKPVYAEFAGASLPAAQKLCGALHDLPVARRAACCGGSPATSMPATECTRIVSAALRAGGVRLDAAAVDRCAAAQNRALEDCSWVGQWLVPLPGECKDLFVGGVKEGGICRSSLECSDGLHCLGVGPTEAGRCGPPRSAGQACLTAVDALATYTRQDDETHHPECVGYCGHRRCMPSAAPGGACSLARECPRGQHCDGKACVAGAFAQPGDNCVGDACHAGLRCVAGRCQKPREDGAACNQDYECRGGCIPATHKCGMRCDAY